MWIKYLLPLAMVFLLGSGTGRTSVQEDLSCQLPRAFISQYDAPEFDPAVFRHRRQRLYDKMNGEVAIISANGGNDFIYLTGITGDPQALAVLDPSSDTPYVLFMLPRDPMTTLWDGERIGTEGAVTRYGADAAYAIAELADRLPAMISGKKSISLLRSESALEKRISRMAGNYKGSFSYDLEPLVHEMRVIKDEWETAHLRKAVEVTSLAHRRVMSTVRPGQKEYDARAEIEYVFMKNGLTTGFPSIVGSGPNAAILHYVHNDRTLQDGDLLLIDVGAASGNYVADVTRTIPVNGKFSDRQRELYSLILTANQEAIRLMVPGRKILDCHHRATEIIVRGLYDIGLITDTTSWWQKRFYIQYRNNHYIGLHVHDVGSYGDLDAPNRDSYILNPQIRGRDVLPGMVMTIEPGIYLIADRLDHLHELFGHRASTKELNAFAEKVRPVYEKYAGIGIRIEDDVLITQNGNIVLSDAAPKTIEDIEAAMKR
jgi:Xaa-Pro aminopeptidase